MNTQDRVNEKIAKVALKNQEIELASIAELDGFVGALEKALSQIKNNSSKLSKNLRDIDSVIDDLKVNYRTAEANKKAVDQAIKSSEILAKEISKQAKDLGIDPKASAVYVNGSKTFVEYAKGEDRAKAIANDYIKIR